MKKHNLLAAAFVAAGMAAQAQITITDADMPAANDTVRLSYALSSGPTDYHLTGASFLWDFSALVPSAQQLIRYETPSAFPFNFTATYGVYNLSPDSLPVIGTVPSNFYDYYKVSGSSLKQVGQSFEFNFSFAIPVIYNNADYVYRFPLNYGNIDSCQYDYGFSIPGFGYFGQDGSRHNEADGWGTLITPFGSFQTLRVKSVVDITDTVSLDTSGNQGFSLQRPQLTQYKWLGQGSKAPLLQIDVQDIAGNDVVTGVYYQDSLRSNVFQVSVPELGSDAGLSLFPNPSQGDVWVKYQLDRPGDVRIRLFDLTGKLAGSWSYPGQPAGTRTEQLSLGQIDAGIYFLEIQAGNRMITRKICKN